MLRHALLSVAFVMGAAWIQPVAAQGTSPADLVERAVKAQGGADALRGLKALAIKAKAQHWEPEQSQVAGGEARFLGDSNLDTLWQPASASARIISDRSMKYPATETLKYTEVVTPTGGYVITGDKRTPMSGIRVAALQRELERISPLLLLSAQKVAALPATAQTSGGPAMPSVSITGTTAQFTVFFDEQTGLPAIIRTKDDDNIHGDSNYDLVLADWRPVGDAKLAHSLTYRLNGVDVAKIAYQEVTANPPVPADALAIPDDLKAAAKGPTAENVPYQWVIRRLALGRFTDSDAVHVDNGASLKLVELAPNVQQVVGGSHNSLIVAQKDGLVIFDAPIHEGQSRWTIDAAKAKYPGKPIKYLVLTHHHMDHTGGTRTYIAEGATLVVPAPDKAYFEKIAAAPHTVAPDALQKNPKPVKIMEVADQATLKDEGGQEEVRVYRIANPHVEGMLIGHVVGDNIAWVTDIYSPGRDKTKTAGTAAFAAAAQKAGIQNARYAGGHGSNGDQAQLDAIMAQK